jgi:hypothetical protein
MFNWSSTIAYVICLGNAERVVVSDELQSVQKEAVVGSFQAVAKYLYGDSEV